MTTSAHRIPKPEDPRIVRSNLKVVRDLGFAADEAQLQQEILEALGERAMLVRASITAGLLGLLALLFAAHAVAVTFGAVTPMWAGRVLLGAALLSFGGVIALIAYGLRHPTRPAFPPPQAQPAEESLARRIS